MKCLSQNYRYLVSHVVIDFYDFFILHFEYLIAVSNFGKLSTQKKKIWEYYYGIRSIFPPTICPLRIRPLRECPPDSGHSRSGHIIRFNIKNSRYAHRVNMYAHQIYVLKLELIYVYDMPTTGMPTKRLLLYYEYVRLPIRGIVIRFDSVHF